MSLLGAGLRAALAAVLIVLAVWALARFAGTWVAIVAGTLGGLAFLIGLTFAGVSRLVQAGTRFLGGLRDVLQPRPAVTDGGPAAGATGAADAVDPDVYASAAAMRREIAAAAALTDPVAATAARLDRLARAGRTMRDPALARSVAALVAAADPFAARLAAAPRPMHRLQRALTRQLTSVEAVLVTLLALQEDDAADPALTRQAIAVIDRLTRDLHARRRASGHDVLETEARLRVLQEELNAAGRSA